MNIAIVDAGGYLLASARMDGAILGSIDIALTKAMPSRQYVSPHSLKAVSAGPKRSTATDAAGCLLGIVFMGADRRDAPLFSLRHLNRR